MSDYECPNCKTEHDATGSHEDDIGETQCDECGFWFIVDIEYDPSYSTSCKNHTYGEPRISMDGETDFRACVHCCHVIILD